MCRITGIWDKQKVNDLHDICICMRDTLARGGPDDAGIFMDKEENLALGHRRLSIIDLSPTGHQPMSTTDGRYTICYNGEVYNYQEIKKDLEKVGVKFLGTSDTEVVLNAFALWGTRSIERFIGMFAFSIWDSHEKALYLFRDRIGIKPLYYYGHNGTFAFASELKALYEGIKPLEINLDSLKEFFHYGYIAAPKSIYQHTFKVEPGHWIKIDQEHHIEKHQYWSYQIGRSEIVDNEDVLIDRLEELMIDAFKLRMVADVDVGIFLSGGIDSSLVTAILSHHTRIPVKTFTIGFKEKGYDESGWARRIAEHLGTAHTEEIVTPEHAKAILPLWSGIYDEPFGDISGIPTTIVSQMTRSHVKVSLSADGGDELFCGYHRYRVMSQLKKYLEILPKFIPRMAGRAFDLFGNERMSSLAQLIPSLQIPALNDRMRKFQTVLSNWNGNAANAYPYAVSYWLPHEINELVGKYTDPRLALQDFGNNFLKSMMQWDIHYYLPDDILTKVDRATMFNGLEGRDPFLDHRIAEFASRLPLNMKWRGKTQKYILKRLLERYIPKELFERPKQGFAVPIYEWLHNDLMDLVDRYLNPVTIKEEGTLNPMVVENTVSIFKSQKGSVAVDRIWLLIVYMMWRERYC